MNTSASKSPATLVSQELKADIFTLKVPGDLISTNVAAVRTAANRLLDNPRDTPLPWKTLVLDLSAASTVDSTGLNLIITLAKAMKQAGGKAQVIYSSQDLERVFGFTRMGLLVELQKAPSRQ